MDVQTCEPPVPPAPFGLDYEDRGEQSYRAVSVPSQGNMRGIGPTETWNCDSQAGAGTASPRVKAYSTHWYQWSPNHWAAVWRPPFTPMRPLFNTLKLGYFEPLHSYYPFEHHFLVGLMPFPSVLGKNYVQFKLLIGFLRFLLIFSNGLAPKCWIFLRKYEENEWKLGISCS
jgi:hypothetical protein